MAIVRDFSHVGRLVCGIIVVLIMLTEIALAERRVALVIGNSSYKNPALSLPNPKNDADDVAAILRGYDFEVLQATDVNKRDFDRLLQDFARRAVGADAVLFFYAGHAMQYQGRNYLVPADAELIDYFSLRSEAIAIDDAREALDRAGGIKVMILDACRDNPLAERLVRSAGVKGRNLPPAPRGLARIDSSPGMIVAYATQANAVADDGAGRNSPFTEALVKRMQEPQHEIGAMFRLVGADVLEQTKGRQLPEVSTSFFGEFYLSPADRVYWTRIKESNDPSAFRNFVARFPNSSRAQDAQRRVEGLERAAREREIQRQLAEREALRQRELAELRAKLAEAQRQKEGREVAERRQAEANAKLAEAQRLRTGLEAAKAEQQRLARAQAERDRDAREQAERDRVSREQAERDRTASEQAERDRLAKQAAPKAQIQTAMVTPPSEQPAPVAVSPAPLGGELIHDIKKELQRVGCFSGDIDDQWASDGVRASVQNFARYAGLTTTHEEPTPFLLDLLRGKPARVCPLECGRREIERNGRCVARTCARGQVLDANGNCVGRNDRKKIEAKPTKAAPRVAARPERAEPAARTATGKVFVAPYPGACGSGDVAKCRANCAAGGQKACRRLSSGNLGTGGGMGMGMGMGMGGREAQRNRLWDLREQR